MECFSEWTNTLYNSVTVPLQKGCYGYTFINKGDTGVRVNQTFLKPFPPGRPDLSGESYSFIDPQGRLFNHDFQIVFDALPGLAPAVEIHQYYHI